MMVSLLLAVYDSLGVAALPCVASYIVILRICMHMVTVEVCLAVS